jgi:hypothetical protein
MPELLLKKKWHVPAVSLCTISAFILLYLFRWADDNRLTSWKWAFADIALPPLVFYMLLATVLVYFLMKSPITRQRPSLFLFLCSFAIGAMFWEIPEVIVDASRYFTQAKHLEQYGISYFISQWGHDIHPWTDLPLVPFLYGLVFKFFGESRAFIQVLTTLMFSLTVVCTYLTGRTLWDEETGFYAGALLWGMPYVFSQIPLMLVDIPTMFFLTLSLLTFIKAMEKGGGWIAASAAALFCAVFSKYSAWMMLSVLGVVFLVYVSPGSGVRGQGSAFRTSRSTGKPDTRNPKPETRRYIFRTAMVALISGVLICLMVFMKYDVISEQIRFLREYQAPGLRRWGESFISTFLYQIHPFITAAALCSLYAAFKKKDVKFLIICWLIFLVAVLQIKRSRYVLVVLPMLSLMASYGLQMIQGREIRRYITSCIVAASLVVSIAVYLPFLQSMSLVNLKDAGRLLDSIEAEQAEVMLIPSKKSAVNPSIAVPLLDLYTEKTIMYRHDEGFSLPFEKIRTSPLRFTWEYRNPKYYMAHKDASVEKPAIIIISNQDNTLLPERIKEKIKKYDKIEIFDATTDFFRYSPVAAVYLPEQ